MRAINLVPVFPEAAIELKDLMTNNRNGGHLTAAYVFGIVWANAVNDVATPNKSEWADLYGLDRKTLSKYLDELVDVGYLEADPGADVYVISKSVRFRLTVTANRPHVDNFPVSGEHVPSGGGGDMFPTLGTCSPEIGDMFPTAPPMMIHDNDDIDMGKINAIREIWKALGLDVKGQSFKKMITAYNNDLDALIEICAAWLDWWQNVDQSERINYGLLCHNFKHGVFPPERELTFGEEIALMWENGAYGDYNHE